MTALTVPARPGQDAGLRPVPWRRMAWVTWRQHRAVLAGAAPALIGAFVGAPVLARELETGTFRYAWTQGFGRWRWTLAKLVPLAVTLTAAAGAFSVLFSWYFQPFLADGWQIPFGPTVFDLRGVAFAAWTLAAFAIATLAVYAGLALAAGLYLRQHYMTPLLTSNPNVPGSAWIISQWYTKDGQPVSQSALSQVLQRGAPQLAGKGGLPQSPTVTQYLIQHGYKYWLSYQPGSRFWPFQWIEGGWLLALSVLLIAVTVWLVRRRAA